MNPNVAALSSDFLTWLGLAFDIFERTDWIKVLMVLFAFFAMGLLAFWQLTPRDGFDLRALGADKVARPNGEIQWEVRPGKLFQTGAFVYTTWQMISLTSSGHMTEWYFAMYAVLWAASPVMNRIALSKFSVPSDTPPGDEPTTTVNQKTTTETVVSGQVKGVKKR